MNRRLMHESVACRGAAAGEGLGNAFLSHIQAVDGIFHVCRGFEVLLAIPRHVPSPAARQPSVSARQRSWNAGHAWLCRR